MIIHNLNKFIELRDKIECVLPSDIVILIKELTMSIVEVQSNNKSYDFNDKLKKKKKIDSNDYPSLPKTILNKKTGINKEIDLIRVLLNKLTKSTYIKIYSELVVKLDSLDNLYSKDECILLGQSIFDILVDNNLFSDLISNLLKDLFHFTFIESAIYLKINNFKNIFDNRLEDCNNIINYEEIYRKNKELDKNKSIASMISNLVKNKTIDMDIIIDLVDKFLDIFFNLINIKNNVKNVEEISDIVFILIKDSYSVIKDSIRWENIINNINYIINIKVVSRLSLSQRVIYKFMDLKDTVY